MILKKVYEGETGLLITGISYIMVFILKLNFEISLGLGLRKKSTLQFHQTQNASSWAFKIWATQISGRL